MKFPLHLFPRVNTGQWLEAPLQPGSTRSVNETLPYTQMNLRIPHLAASPHIPLLPAHTPAFPSSFLYPHPAFFFFFSISIASLCFCVNDLTWLNKSICLKQAKSGALPGGRRRIALWKGPGALPFLWLELPACQAWRIWLKIKGSGPWKADEWAQQFLR